jgi:hypothetical protein
MKFIFLFLIISFFSCVPSQSQTLTYLNSVVDSEISFTDFFLDSNKFIVGDQYFFYRRDWYTQEYVLIDLYQGEIIDERILDFEIANTVGSVNEYLVILLEGKLKFYNVLEDIVIDPEDYNGSGIFYWFQEEWEDDYIRLFRYDFSAQIINEIQLDNTFRTKHPVDFSNIYVKDDTLICVEPWGSDETQYHYLNINSDTFSINNYNVERIPIPFAHETDDGSFVGLNFIESTEGFENYFVVTLNFQDNILDEYKDVLAYGFTDTESFIFVNDSRNLALIIDYDREGLFETDESISSGWPIRSAIISCYRIEN